MSEPSEATEALGANGQAVQLLDIGGRIVEVDTEIAPIVAALNAAGVPTRASCSGHDNRPANIALQDGREIIIARDHAEGRLIDRAMQAARPTVGDEQLLREALEWYAEQAEGCRKIGSIGDPSRQALDDDGGKRARAALARRPLVEGE
jgi:hypothetical protein